MISSPLNREVAVLQNIVDTLSQLKAGGQVNLPLVLDHINSQEDEYVADCTVDFYVDQDQTQLLFTADSDDNADCFGTQSGRTTFVPPDEWINFSIGLSDQFAQPLYYATATFADGTIIDQTYRNVDNLVFQSVIVTTKAGAKFAQNENTCMIYPRQEKIEFIPQNEDIALAVFPIDLYLQVLVPNYTNLSEQERWEAGQNVSNLVRNALMVDRYRGGNCTLKDKDLDGTGISQLQVLPSNDVLKAKIEIRTCYFVSSTTY